MDASYTVERNNRMLSLSSAPIFFFATLSTSTLSTRNAIRRHHTKWWQTSTMNALHQRCNALVTFWEIYGT